MMSPLGKYPRNNFTILSSSSFLEELEKSWSIPYLTYRLTRRSSFHRTNEGSGLVRSYESLVIRQYFTFR